MCLQVFSQTHLVQRLSWAERSRVQNGPNVDINITWKQTNPHHDTHAMLGFARSQSPGRLRARISGARSASSAAQASPNPAWASASGLNFLDVCVLVTGQLPYTAPLPCFLARIKGSVNGCLFSGQTWLLTWLVFGVASGQQMLFTSKPAPSMLSRFML